MIKMHIERNTEGSIREFTLEGHADFAEPGSDIVCAAVSGITFGTLRAIETLLAIQLETEAEEETGFLHCVVPQAIPESAQENIQLLLEGMRVSLLAVEEEYGDYLTIKEV